MRRLVLVLIALAVAIPRAEAACPLTGPCDCDQLDNPVFLQVGDTQVNLLKRLGRALRDNVDNPITLVWTTNGSCDNVALAFTDGTTSGGTVGWSWIPSTAEDATFNVAGAAKACTVANKKPDIVNSALFVSSCPHGPVPATLKSTIGPVQAYVLAVPEASTQTAITFEEAYFVFGFGAAGMVSPWNLEAQHFIRPATKSTLLTWALNLTIPANKWHNIANCTTAPATAPCFEGSGGVVTALKNSTMPEAAIGLLGIEVYDAERASLNVLAYKAKDQYFAYYPDSTATSRDKKNVRDGHYTVWSPTEWLQKVNGSGTPINARADYVINLIASREVTPAPNFDPVPILTAVGLVPDCAMRVKRDFDGGDLSLYTPPTSCECKFEALTDVSSCESCANGESCASGVCRAGFCEAF